MNSTVFIKERITLLWQVSVLLEICKLHIIEKIGSVEIIYTVYLSFRNGFDAVPFNKLILSHKT